MTMKAFHLRVEAMLKRFVLHTGGAVAPLFAIAVIPMFCAVGAAVDFSRAYQERTVVQDALDAAALSGGRDIGVKTTDEIKVEVGKYYLANIGDKLGDPPALDPQISGGTITINTTLHVPTLFLRIIGLDELVFHMTTQAKAGMGTLEIVMVLDNSSSMCLGCSAAQQNNSSTKIGALKVAATDLTDKLFALQATSTQPDPVKMALVPFAGSVNVGATSAVAAGWVDTAGKGFWSGDAQKGEGAAATLNPYALFAGLKDSSNNAITWGGCVQERPDPYDVDDTAPSTSANPTADESKTMFTPMFAPDEPDNWTCDTSNCSYAGSSGARRYNGANTNGNQEFNNYLPDAGDPTTCPAVFKPITAVSSTNDTFTTSAANRPANGTQVNIMSTSSMPGAVSANTRYYVVSSNSSSNTFKISTSSGGTAVNISSAGSGTIRYALVANWTCGNGNTPCDGTGIGRSERQALAGTTVASAEQCKYGTVANKATVPNITAGNLKGGPNFMCTTKAITPLTTTKQTVIDAVNAQEANGYTNITAGIAWGRRVLSDTVPFTEGRPVTDINNLKVMIVMTDGENTYNPYMSVGSNPSSSSASGKYVKSAYGAWGYLYKNHFGTTSTQSATVLAALNTRTAAACASAKTAGVKIYTIAFQVTDAATLNMLSTCASDPSMAYQSGNNQSLLDAFTAIGESITSLRVSM
jgi:Flp pilus assembly protein TadG